MSAKKKTSKRKSKRKSRSGASRRSGSGGVFGRLLARILFWGVALLVLAGVLAGTFLGLHHVLFVSNPHFELQHIAFSGNATLTERALRERLIRSGVIVNESNLLSLPVEKLRHELEKDPLVEEARIFRKLPDTLSVSVRERDPIATVQCQNPCFVDEDGIVLPWRDISGERLLPVITGVRQAHKLTPGEKVHDEPLRGAVRLLRVLSTRPDGVAYDIAIIQLDYYLPSLRVHLRPRGTFREGAVVVVPVQGMDSALNRLRDICRIRTAEGRTTGFVDVTYKRNVPVQP